MGKNQGKFVPLTWSSSEPESTMRRRQPTDKSADVAKPTVKDPSIRSKVRAITPKDVSLWRPDVYAHKFIPRSLLAINSSPARSISLAPNIGIDFNYYISTFAGSDFLRAVSEPPNHMYRASVPVESLSVLGFHNYGHYFGSCLTLDLEAQVLETRIFDLYGVTVEPFDSVKQLYSLRVPGLREGTPPVSLGDALMLRQLILDPLTRLPHGTEAWLTSGGYERGEMAPGFTGSQVRAVVRAIDKANELLIMNAVGLGSGIQIICNVVFEVPPRLSNSLYRAVSDVAHELLRDEDSSSGSARQHTNGAHTSLSSSEAGETPVETSADAMKIGKLNRYDWLRRMLFPVEAYGIRQDMLPSAVFPQIWVDKALNFEQQVRISVD